MTAETFSAAIGIDHPIIQGPMGGVAGVELVAAVSNAGALGVLPIWAETIPAAISLMAQTHALTERPFAVNLRADLIQLDHIHAALDAGVTLIHLFWDDPAASMAPLRDADASMIATVWDPESARRAVDAGAVALIAQGTEAGGHVMSEIPLDDLLTDVLTVAEKLPVVAAGGCADGSDGRRLLDLGASGILFGTRFVACKESLAHPEFKAAIVAAEGEATARSLCFDDAWPDAPHRTLINDTYRAWDEANRPAPGQRPGEGDVVLRGADGMELQRYHVMPPQIGMTGDILNGALYAGTGVSRIADCPGAAELVARIVTEMG